MSFESYRTTDSIARQRSAISTSRIKYLGYIISADGLRMDPSKISAVQSWPTPKKVRDLQVLPFILETDASDYAISGVLSQYDDSNTLRPIAFYARQMNSAEQNYEIYDKELLAVVESFKHWRHFLKAASIQSLSV
ncbi:hypothetical protein BASA81_017605 [Batrachochytrium salamandrivorans]|nr:hypothetical protein BASA81_017605 [Batrachochytrium salamandrivorans]